MKYSKIAGRDAQIDTAGQTMTDDTRLRCTGRYVK
jgi:hypothetical protein